jgi:CheY-like chemotaxis protein
VSERPLRVLYVDDDRINTLLFVEVCRPQTQLQVFTAAHTTEALELAREQTPDVLVLDLHLHDTDGYQLLAQLRQLDGLTDVPAFLCTAERLEEVREPAAKAGFRDVWIKPVLLTPIEQALELDRTKPARPHTAPQPGALTEPDLR